MGKESDRIPLEGPSCGLDSQRSHLVASPETGPCIEVLMRTIGKSAHRWELDLHSPRHIEEKGSARYGNTHERVINTNNSNFPDD